MEGFLESLVMTATLRFELDPAPLEIQADVSQIEQVLRTLIVNASEAIGEGGGTITIRTRRLLADRAALAKGNTRRTLRSHPPAPGPEIAALPVRSGDG